MRLLLFFSVTLGIRENSTEHDFGKKEGVLFVVVTNDMYFRKFRIIKNI